MPAVEFGFYRWHGEFSNFFFNVDIFIISFFYVDMNKKFGTCWEKIKKKEKKRSVALPPATSHTLSLSPIPVRRWNQVDNAVRIRQICGWNFNPIFQKECWALLLGSSLVPPRNYHSPFSFTTSLPNCASPQSTAWLSPSHGRAWPTSATPAPTRSSRLFQRLRRQILNWR